jgi:hypothetical protein
MNVVIREIARGGYTRGIHVSCGENHAAAKNGA